MFKLQPNPTFPVEVTFPTPTGEGKIKFEFHHKGKKALQAFYASLNVDGVARDDDDAVSEIVSGWSGTDEKFSKEALSQLLDDYIGAAPAIFEAYQKGILEGKQKNS